MPTQQDSPNVPTETRLKFLERENELLNSIIQGASDSIYAKDLDGKYISINEAGARYLGRTVEEVIGKTDEQLLGPSGAEIMEKDRDLFRSGEPTVYESELLIESETRYFRTSKSPLKNLHGEVIGLIGISRDVTTAKRAEDKYRYIFEHAPIAFWEEDFSDVLAYLNALKLNGITDLRAYFNKHPKEVVKCVSLIKVLNVNHATVQMNAATGKDELLASVSYNFTPESKGLFIDEFVALASGKTEFQKECSFVNRNGDVVNAVLNLSVMPGHEHSLSLVLVSVVDVTDLRKLTSELTHIRHRYESIVEAQTEMICRLSPKGTILFSNQAFKRFFPIEKDEHDVTFTSLFPADEEHPIREHIAAFSAARPTTVCEVRNYDPQGHLVWQEWTITAFFGTSGVLLGYQAVGKDITERRNAQEALATSEARWRSVFNHADDLIMTLNTDGYILSINDYDGLPKDQKWAGRKIDEVLRAENVSRIKKLLSKVVDTAKPLKTEVDIVSPQGEKRVFSAAISPISYGKRVISMVIIARDITATKQLEKRTKEALIEGQERERMRVSQELHDGLGQLFTVIKFNIQHIRSSIEHDPKEELLDQIDRLEQLVGTAFREVKNISHNLMPDVLGQFGLRPAVEDMVEKLNQGSGPIISLQMVDMDKRFGKELEQALYRICQELINNAVRHAQCSTVYVQFIHHGESLMLIVEDDGIGYDTKTITRGSGLQNIRSRVELLDGTLEIDSSKEHGTVTSIEIPLSTETAQT